MIEKLCRYRKSYKKQILFRFTIGSKDNEVLNFGEPYAPSYEERIKCLEYAHDKGYKVSVSIEPMLDPDNIGDLLNDLPAIEMESVWIGKMNHTSRIAVRGSEELRAEIIDLERAQSDDNILNIYHDWKHETKIRWKDSVQKVIDKSVN